MRRLLLSFRKLAASSPPSSAIPAGDCSDAPYRRHAIGLPISVFLLRFSASSQGSKPDLRLAGAAAAGVRCSTILPPGLRIPAEVKDWGENFLKGG